MDNELLTTVEEKFVILAKLAGWQLPEFIIWPNRYKTEIVPISGTDGTDGTKCFKATLYVEDHRISYTGWSAERSIQSCIWQMLIWVVDHNSWTPVLEHVVNDLIVVRPDLKPIFDTIRGYYDGQ